jgi:hypothetical protein
MPLWLRKFTFNKLKEWHAPPDEDAKENSWTKNSIAKEEASKNKKINPQLILLRHQKNDAF